MDNLFAQINADIIASMKSGDKTKLETLRMMKSKILLVNARGDLPEKEIIRILQNYAKSVKETADVMSQHNRMPEADQAKKELMIVEIYLPRMLSEEETKKLVKDAITALGITSPKEIGRIMKEVLSNRTDVDGSLARKIFNESFQS
ncbi:MAG: GatB/YqeY domain-containing protein [Candidatus Margulisiibacteriota bacterium]